MSAKATMETVLRNAQTAMGLTFAHVALDMHFKWMV